MMLSASTWVPVTQMKTDTWTTVIPQAVTIVLQSTTDAMEKIGDNCSVLL